MSSKYKSTYIKVSAADCPVLARDFGRSRKIMMFSSLGGGELPISTVNRRNRPIFAANGFLRVKSYCLPQKKQVLQKKQRDNIQNIAEKLTKTPSSVIIIARRKAIVCRKNILKELQ